MKKIFTFIFLLCTFSSFAQLWMRYPAISPDGKQIVFSYKGNIYIVPSDGGEAKLLYGSSYYCNEPVWSNDSKSIAFASDKYGNFDIFTINTNGTQLKRLTSNSAKETPYAFSKDNSKIIFGANIEDPVKSVLFPTGTMTELYSVSVEPSSAIKQICATPVEYPSFIGNDGSYVYQDKKGGENIWRKHHTSSITRDIWLYDAKTKTNKKLTDFKGEDRNPRVASDNSTIYFLSERGGNFNVWKFDISNPGNCTQVTNFKTDPVRFLTIANNNTLCFGWNGEIYIKEENKEAKKVNISIIENNDNEQIDYVQATPSRDNAVSADGKQIAFISNGDVFVTSVDYTTTKQITSTPESESNPNFNNTGDILAYDSKRDGKWNIYFAKTKVKDDKNFSTSTLIDESAMINDSKHERQCPKFSPSGEEVAFVEDRCKIAVYNIKSKAVRYITDGSTHYGTTGDLSFNWSPDSKWLTIEHTPNHHEPYTDIAIVKADGKGKIYNLTQSGYTDYNPQFVMDGNAILYFTERYGMRNHASWGSLRDVMLVFLNKQAYEKFCLSKEDFELLDSNDNTALNNEKPQRDAKGQKDDKAKAEDKEQKVKDIVVDLNNIEDRVVRLTPTSSQLSGATIDKKAKKLYYLCSFEKGYDLWEMDLRNHNTKILKKMGTSPASLCWDSKYNTLFILGSSMYKMSPNGSPAPITARYEMAIDRNKQREYMYNHVCTEEARRFYQVKMHGVDWNRMTKHYAQFLPYINNNYDFSELLSELLGELNVSHTGSGYRARFARTTDNTSSLGIFTDLYYTGDGIKIAEIVTGGPLDKSNINLKAGDIITHIDGEKIVSGKDYFHMLNRKANKRVLIQTKDQEYIVKPISQGNFKTLLYKRWIRNCEKIVDSLSGGRLGYVHIESMNDESFREVYSQVLGKYNHCDGIVIDTRFNGGGRLHEDIEVLFSGSKYLTQVIRGKESCDMPSRRYNKKSIMITGEANYSNAHGTPWVYKHKNMGKIVGMPVPGTMTSVNWETLQDPTLYFGIPVVGYRTQEGTYLENSQLEPDITVANNPDTVINGQDMQLEAAVKELLKEIDRK